VADPSRQTFRTSSYVSFLFLRWSKHSNSLFRYEYRLWKYSKRGFAVAIPGFSRAMVHSGVYLKKFGKLTGLGRLLFFEERDYQKSSAWHNMVRWDEEKPFSATVGDHSALKTSICDSRTGMSVQVHDYNRSAVLPYDNRCSASSLNWHLVSRVERILSTYVSDGVKTELVKRDGPPGTWDLPHLYFVYSKSLKGILDRDACAQKMIKDSRMDFSIKYLGDKSDGEDDANSADVDAPTLASAFGDKFVWHLPPRIEFIGSMKEVCLSLSQTTILLLW
jgi:hypothetical protein